MRSVLDSVEKWVADGERVAIATVAETRRSVPQPVGTKLAVCAGGEVAGGVSGGCVDGAVIEAAERVLAGEPPALLHYGIADEDAWNVGLPCGGEVTVWVEAYDPAGPQARFFELARSDARAVLVTVVGGEPLGAKLLVEPPDITTGSFGDRKLTDGALECAHGALSSGVGGLHMLTGSELFVDVVAPRPKLIMVGAVEFAVQLSALAAMTGWRPFVVDPRPRFATSERFPAAERVIGSWPDEGFAELGSIDASSAIVVLTNDPKLDDAALLAALGSSAGYVGAIGSRRAQDKRRERLVAAGVTDEQLARVAGPIGLDLGALTSAETALSIMSEIVALRHGRRGGRLAVSNERIHGSVVPGA